MGRAVHELAEVGLELAESRKPKEKAPAVMPRDQPNSMGIGGKSSEKDVRALTASAMVTKAKATTVTVTLRLFWETYSRGKETASSHRAHRRDVTID